MRASTRINLAVLCLLFLNTDASAATKWLKDKHPSLPNPLTHIWQAVAAGNIHQIAQYYVMGVPWCSATGLMLASVTLRRELKLSEAHTIVAGCILPIIGGIIAKHYFDQHPEFDLIPLKAKPLDPSIKSQS